MINLGVSRQYLLLPFILLMPLRLVSQTARPAQADSIREILLWTKAPGAVGDKSGDRPSITVYPAKKTARTMGMPGTAVIVIPGGAYYFLATPDEGTPVAQWLSSLGITAFVLKYRIGAPYRHPTQLIDAQRAIRLVRGRAAEFGIDPNCIGLMGFSAGGHLAAMAGTHGDTGNPTAPDSIDRQGSQVRFLVLGYPVISFQSSVTGLNPLAAYAGSGRNLLGTATADSAVLAAVSAELQVTAQTPPTFLYHGSTDGLVSVMNSVVFYQALLRAGVPAELHTFERADHGGALNLDNPVFGVWPTMLKNWLDVHGWLPAM